MFLYEQLLDASCLMSGLCVLHSAEYEYRFLYFILMYCTYHLCNAAQRRPQNHFYDTSKIKLLNADFKYLFDRGNTCFVANQH